MDLFSPCRSQWRVLRDGRCGGRLRGLLVVVGLLVAWPAPLPAAAQPERGGTIVWAVHESLPSFDLLYDNSYIVGQPIGPLYNGLLTFDVYKTSRSLGTWPSAGMWPLMARRLRSPCARGSRFTMGRLLPVRMPNTASTSSPIRSVPPPSW